MREGIIDEKYDAFAASLLQLGLIGIWSQRPLIDGREMKTPAILPSIPKGPILMQLPITHIYIYILSIPISSFTLTSTLYDSPQYP
jgi:hypothetical protein